MKPACRLVDCPGYGYAKASQVEKENWRKFMQIYLMSSSSLQRVMLLVDLSVGLQDSDKLLMDTLTESSQPFTLVLTKVDKIKQGEKIMDKAKTTVDQVIDSGFTLCNPIVHLVSSYSGFGLKELRSNAVFTLEQEKLTK